MCHLQPHRPARSCTNAGAWLTTTGGKRPRAAWELGLRVKVRGSLVLGTHCREHESAYTIYTIDPKSLRVPRTARFANGSGWISDLCGSHSCFLRFRPSARLAKHICLTSGVCCPWCPRACSRPWASGPLAQDIAAQVWRA